MFVIVQNFLFHINLLENYFVTMKSEWKNCCMDAAWLVHFKRKFVGCLLHYIQNENWLRLLTICWCISTANINEIITQLVGSKICIWKNICWQKYNCFARLVKTRFVLDSHMGLYGYLEKTCFDQVTISSVGGKLRI